MRWPVKPPPDEEKWHKVFAFLPHKTLTEEWVWLEFILRQESPRPYTSYEYLPNTNHFTPFIGVYTNEHTNKRLQAAIRSARETS